MIAMVCRVPHCLSVAVFDDADPIPGALESWCL
jgi:hypothetical protein